MDPVLFGQYVQLALLAIQGGEKLYAVLHDLFQAKGLTSEQIDAINANANAESLRRKVVRDEMGLPSGGTV